MLFAERKSTYCKKVLHTFISRKQDFNLMQKKGKQFSNNVQQSTSNSHETSLCASNKKELNCNKNCILERSNI
jgi:hypothetical protein